MNYYRAFLTQIEIIKNDIKFYLGLFVSFITPFFFILSSLFYNKIEFLNRNIKTVLSFFIEYYKLVVLKYSQIILDNSVIIITLITIVVCSIIFLFLLSMGIKVVRNLKFYINQFLGNKTILLAFVKQFFTKNFYIQSRMFLEKLIIFKIYELLLYLWDFGKNIPLIENPYKFRDLIKKRLVEFYKNSSFTKKTYLFVKNKFKSINDSIFFPDLSKVEQIKSKDTTGNVYDMLPEEIKNLTKDQSYNKPYFYDFWKTEIDNYLTTKINNTNPSILVCGVKGCGKTNLLRYIESHYQNVFYYDLNSREVQKNIYTTITKKIDEINLTKSSQNKEYIVIDGLEKLFLKKIGGFEILKWLFNLITETKKNIYWVCSLNSLFYDYINKILSIDSIFYYKFNFSKFDSEFLLSVFEKKFRDINYNIKIIPDKKTIQDIKKKIRHKIISHNEVSRYIKKAYFQKLYNYGKENFYFHFNYFVRSIKNVRDRDVYLEMPQLFSHNEIEKISTDNIFIIYTLMLHGCLDIDTLSEVLLMPKFVLSVKISHYIEENIIIENEGQYSVNPYYYPSLIKKFEEKSLL